MNKNLGLTTTGINSLTNKELKADVQAIALATISAARSTWDVAYHMTRVINGETFKDDFETKNDFYTFLGFKPSNATQYIKAYEFMVRHNQVSFDDAGNPKTAEIKGSIAIAYLLFGLDSKGELAEFDKFFVKKMKSIKAGNVTVYDVTAGTLKDLIEEFHNSAAETAEAGTADAATADVGAADKDSKKEKTRKEPETAEDATKEIMRLAKKFSIKTEIISSQVEAVKAIKRLYKNWNITQEMLKPKKATKKNPAQEKSDTWSEHMAEAKAMLDEAIAQNE